MLRQGSEQIYYIFLSSYFGFPGSSGIQVFRSFRYSGPSNPPGPKEWPPKGGVKILIDFSSE